MTDSATLFTRHPRQPAAVARALAVLDQRGDERRGDARRGRDAAALPRRGPARLLAPDLRTLARRRVQLGRRRAPLDGVRRHARRGGMGPRGPARDLRRGARPLDHHLHGVRPRRARSLARADRGLQDVRAPGRRHARPRTRTPSCSRAGSTATGCSSTGRSRPTAPRCGSRARATSSTGTIRELRAEPPPGRLVGLRARRHGPAAARDRARLARRLPRRAPDRRGRPVSRGPGAARPRPARRRPAALGGMGARPGRRLRGLGRRPERRLSRAASSTTRTPTSCSSTTEPPTPASASPPPAARTCSRTCSSARRAEGRRAAE